MPTCERRAKEAQYKNKGKPGTGSVMTANTTSYANSKPNLNLKFNKKWQDWNFYPYKKLKFFKIKVEINFVKVNQNKLLVKYKILYSW